ncbi:MAG TPA: hypothetical protein VH643_32005 [Gemmataceae bacterium]|jgi:hypothetical protein
MGRGFVKYHLPESGRDEWVLWSAFIDYRLVDGTKLHILQQPAWCPTCGRFVIAEEIPSVAAFEEEIARYRSGERDTLQEWAFVSNGLPVEERVAELLRYVEWRRTRQSPPRCLKCGAIDPVPVPMSGEFAHPRTGEHVRVESSGFADCASWFAEFSPEGEKLA